MKIENPGNSSGGYDILRLTHPPVEDFNEDFLCGICKSIYTWFYFLEILMNPVECPNS